MKKNNFKCSSYCLWFFIWTKKKFQLLFKAIEANDTATANAQIGAADAILGGKTYL